MGIYWKFYEIAEGQDFPLILHSKQLEILLRSLSVPPQTPYFQNLCFLFFFSPAKHQNRLPPPSFNSCLASRLNEHISSLQIRRSFCQSYHLRRHFCEHLTLLIIIIGLWFQKKMEYLLKGTFVNSFFPCPL